MARRDMRAGLGFSGTGLLFRGVGNTCARIHVLTLVVMKDLLSEYNSCLYHSSSALHRWLGKIANEQFRAVELSPTEGFGLITLKAAPGIIISDMAHVHQLDATTLTKVVDNLAKRGFLRREKFGRSYRLFGTGKGDRKEADAQAAWKKLRFEYESLIGEAEATVLAQSISEILPDLRPET
jgi:MarR family transcriptional regulator, organic hydroperoxide resistance regulator